MSSTCLHGPNVSMPDCWQKASGGLSVGLPRPPGLVSSGHGKIDPQEGSLKQSAKKQVKPKSSAQRPKHACPLQICTDGSMFFEVRRAWRICWVMLRDAPPAPDFAWKRRMRASQHAQWNNPKILHSSAVVLFSIYLYITPMHNIGVPIFPLSLNPRP